MKRAEASRQNGVAGKLSRQNDRQRYRVRRETPVAAETLANQEAIRPSQQDASTTTRPT